MPVLAAIELTARTTLRRHGVSSRWHATRHGLIHSLEGAGSGELGAIVCVHGLASSGSSFAQSIPELLQSFSRVVAVDLPGHGASPLPLGRLDSTLLVSTLEEVLLAQSGAPVWLVGNSLGGALVLRFAITHPTKVRGVVLTSPAGAPLSDAELEYVLAHFRLSDVAHARRFFERLYHRPPPLLTAIAWDFRRLVRAPHLTELMDALPEAASFSREELAGLEPPTQLLWGESDRLLPRTARDFFRDALPASTEFESLRGVGHSPHVETPRAFARSVVAFAVDVTTQARERQQARKPIPDDSNVATPK